MLLCHVIFSSKEISKMEPQSAVDKIPNLLISITDHGVQDHKSFLDFYKFFDNKLNECGIERPVVVLTDGNSSRFDPSVLQFCREKEIHLFVGPPDTIGVTHYYIKSTMAFTTIIDKERPNYFQIQ